VGIAIPILILLHLQYRFRVIKSAIGVPGKYLARIKEFEYHRQIRRMTRGIIALLLFIYAIVAVTAIEGLNCIRLNDGEENSGSLVLSISTDVVRS